MQSPRSALIALVALSAAGCFSDRGVAIEVDVGMTGATSVELYVGNSKCADHKNPAIQCDGGIAPPLISAHLAGTVWFRDDMVPYRAAVVAGKATFRLQADTDTDTTLPIVIAVGTSAAAADPVGTATLTDVLVPAKSARIRTTKLLAANPLEPNTTPTTEDRARVWTQPSAGSTCVVVEHWVDGKATRDFIVPGDDPDCDSVNSECDPAAANGSLMHDGIDKKPECFARSTDSDTEPCRLGAFGCADDGTTSTTSTTCFTTLDEVCVPKALCDCRGPGPSDSCTLDTIGDPFSQLVPHITCIVPTQAGSECKVRNSDPIDLNRHLGTSGCKQPTLSSFELANLEDAGRSHSFNGLDLELTSPDKECRFTVQVNSGTHMKAGPELGMVRLVTNQNAVLLPIIFVFSDVVPGCPSELKVACAFDDNRSDPMWHCVP